MPEVNIEMGENTLDISVVYEYSLEGIPEYMVINNLANALKSMTEVNT